MNLAPAWESLAVVRGRFRKNISWLQFPIPKLSDGKQQKDPHTPTTRALELNHEVLNKMLDEVSFEFLDISRLQTQAGQTWFMLVGTQTFTYVGLEGSHVYLHVRLVCSW